MNVNNLFKVTELKLAWLCLLVCSVYFGYVGWLSESSYGGADNYKHFWIAEAAFSHPSLFLHHWGKPLFTLLSSPFAQLGYKGVVLFNTFIAMLTAWVSYRICLKLNYKHSFLAIVMVCFTPIYFSMIPSSMTEVLFSFILCSSFLLLLNARPVMAAGLISFLPFARTEGIILLPFFFFYLLYRKRYAALPFLALGGLLYSIIGYFFVYHDFLWLIHQNPYTGAGDVYGSGGLFDFVEKYDLISGWILSLLFAIGVLKMLFDWRRREGKVFELLLLLGSFVAFLVFHSVLWWKGLGGSLGLVRVMASVAPLLSIISLKGLNGLVEKLTSLKVTRLFVLVLIVYFIVQAPYKYYRAPFPLTPPEQLIKEASDWVKENNDLDQKTIYFYNPIFGFFLDMNPYTDAERIREQLYNPDDPGQYVSIGDIVIWDAQLSPNEGRLPLERMMQSNEYMLLQAFWPRDPFIVLGGYDYEIYVFERVNVNERLPIQTNTIQLEEVKFESLQLTTVDPYSKSIEVLMSRLRTDPYKFFIKAEADYLLLSGEGNNTCELVVTIENKEEGVYYYQTERLITSNMYEHSNVSISLERRIPTPISNDDVLKVYVYQTGNDKIDLKRIALSAY